MAVRELVSIGALVCLVGSYAQAKPVVAYRPVSTSKAIVLKGQIGVIGEWALEADLDPPMTTAKPSNPVYSGALSLRHVGLCSADGPEIKTGVASAPVHAGVADRLTLTFGTEVCVFPGPLPLTTKVSRGALRCQSGAQVPASLWTAP